MLSQRKQQMLKLICCKLELSSKLRQLHMTSLWILFLKRRTHTLCTILNFSFVSNWMHRSSLSKRRYYWSKSGWWCFKWPKGIIIDLSQGDDIVSGFLGVISKISKSKETKLSSSENKSIHLDQSPQISNPLEGTYDQNITKNSVDPEVSNFFKSWNFYLSILLKHGFHKMVLMLHLTRFWALTFLCKILLTMSNHSCPLSIIPKALLLSEQAWVSLKRNQRS